MNKGKEAMEWLAQHDDVVFIGQNLLYPQHQMTDDFKDIDPAKIIEFPVAEDMQMGVSIGMALEGKTVISVYPRFDFLILATNQIVNHLDKLNDLYRAGCPGKVIIRTAVGGTKPLDGGPQHTQDHSVPFSHMCKNIRVRNYKCITNPEGELHESLLDMYQKAYYDSLNRSFLIVD